MEKKFTKGKWEVTSFQNVYCGINIVCAIGDLMKITEEVKANALLISKAPEMFEMLVKIKETTQSESTFKAIEQLLKEATEL